jgi:hypothetical protein
MYVPFNLSDHESDEKNTFRTALIGQPRAMPKIS